MVTMRSMLAVTAALSMTTGAVSAVAGSPAAPAATPPVLSQAAAEAHLRFLADDLLEGRGVERGAAASPPPTSSRCFGPQGLQPAFPPSYQQTVPLLACKVDEDAELRYRTKDSSEHAAPRRRHRGHQLRSDRGRVERQAAVRRPRDHLTGVVVGRLQGPRRQGAPAHRPGQRARTGRPGAVPRPRADPLRTLDRQDGRGGATRGRRPAPRPHRA